MQVGIVNELIGNGLEAESLLSWGKAISCSQSLFPFVVAFSSALGMNPLFVQLYCLFLCLYLILLSVSHLICFILSSPLNSQGTFYHKKQSLDLAEKELQNAKEILNANKRDFSCGKCKLKLEVTLDKQLGEISRKKLERVSQTDGFLHAEGFFTAALGKVCCPAWKSCIRSHGEEILEGIAIEENGGEVSGKTKLGINKEPTESKGSRRGRRAKSSQTRVSKDHDLISEPTSRLTRSMRQSLKEQCQTHILVPEVGSRKAGFCDRSDGSGCERVFLDTKNTGHGFCICYKGKCMQCLSEKVTETGSLNTLVSLKWELCHRRLASSILVDLGMLLPFMNVLMQYEVGLLTVSC